MTADLKTTLEAAMEASPFVRFCGLRMVSFNQDAGTLEMELPHRAELMRGDDGDGMYHGGAIATLVDTAGDFAIAVALGGVVPTINFRVDYFRPARGDKLTGIAVARRIGRSVCVADVDVFGADGKICAIGRGTYSGVKG